MIGAIFMKFGRAPAMMSMVFMVILKCSATVFNPVGRYCDLWLLAPDAQKHPCNIHKITNRRALLQSTRDTAVRRSMNSKSLSKRFNLSSAEPRP